MFSLLTTYHRSRPLLPARLRTVAAVAAVLTLSSAVPAQAVRQLRFPAIADTYVDDSVPATAFGTSSRVLLDASPARLAYLRFRPYGVDDDPIIGARLRIKNSGDASQEGGIARETIGAWGENTTWNDRPALGPDILGRLGSAQAGLWYEMPLSVTGLGDQLNVGLQSPSTDSVGWASREGATPPELVVDVDDGGTGDGLSQVADELTGSSSSTFFASNHRLAQTGGGRLLAVHGRHASGAQLAWRDRGGDWQRRTRGAAGDGQVLAGTGTGDWLASIAVGRSPAGGEYGWVIWARNTYSTSSPQPVAMAQLSDLDSPEGPIIGPTVTVDAPAGGAYRADLAMEPQADGSARAWLVWSRRNGDATYDVAAASFTDIAATSPSLERSIILSGTRSARYGTLVSTPAGIRAVTRGASDRLTLQAPDAPSWSPVATGLQFLSGTRPSAPSAAALPNGDVLATANSDPDAGRVLVQRFSAGQTAATTELDLSGYDDPALVASGERAWLVAVRRSDNAVISRELTPAGWTPADRLEVSVGNHEWPLPAISDGKLRILVRGPSGKTNRTSALLVQRDQ